MEKNERMQGFEHQAWKKCSYFAVILICAKASFVGEWNVCCELSE